MIRLALDYTVVITEFQNMYKYTVYMWRNVDFFLFQYDDGVKLISRKTLNMQVSNYNIHSCDFFKGKA